MQHFGPSATGIAIEFDEWTNSDTTVLPVPDSLSTLLLVSNDDEVNMIDIVRHVDHAPLPVFGVAFRSRASTSEADTATLIEQWMRDNRGPQARIMDGTRELVLTLERLPTLLRDMEETLGLLSHGGLPIHPETMHVLVGADRSMPSWPLVVIMVGIGVLIAHLL